MKTRLILLLSAAALVFSPQVGFGQTPPTLGATASFALFTAAGAIDNNGPSVISGNIGTDVGAFNGFPPGVIVNGNAQVSNPLTTQAAADVQTAYGFYSSNIPCVTPLVVYGGTPAVTLGPGSYCVGGATTLAGTLILDAGGNANAKFYLKVSGSLTTAQNSLVVLQNGANANNVYWQIGGLTTLGQNSVMQGTLLVDGAIIFITGARLEGRGLSRAGAITLTSGRATVPSTATAPAAITTSWLGAALGGFNTDWFNATNWSSGVPTSTVDALVGTGRSPFPVIGSGNAAANGLTIGIGASLTQSGGTLDLKNNLNNSGTISATAGTVSLSGTATQLLGGSGATQLWSLAIANSFGALQTGAVGIRGVLAPSSGSLNTNGQALTLLSNAAGTALVDNSGAGTVVGEATVQRFIGPTSYTGAGYRQYSSPTTNTNPASPNSKVADLATATGFTPEVSKAAEYNNPANPTPNLTTPFPTVYGYNQSRVTINNSFTPFDRGFEVPPALNTPLAAGRGYTVNISGTQLVDFVGTLNNGDLPVSMTRNAAGTANETEAGWQLLGNPYPSPLDYSMVASLDRANLDAAIYVSTSTGPYTVTYRSNVNGMGPANPVLPSGQGFFARVSSGQTNATLTFRNSQRLTVPNATAFQRGTDLRPLVNLELRTSAGAADALYAYAEAGTTAAFDAQYDAVKLLNTTGLNLASVVAGNQSLSVDGRPTFTTATALPLSVGVPTAGSYTLVAAALNNLPVGLDVLLTDAATAQTVNLSQQASYAFVVTPAQLAGAKGRFTLHFANRSGLASAAALDAAAVTLYPNPALAAFTVFVPAIAGVNQVHAELLNALGQVVRRQDTGLRAAGATMVVDAAGLAAGVYTLHLQAGNTTIAKRVVLQ